jgi:hypothetical protein
LVLGVPGGGARDVSLGAFACSVAPLLASNGDIGVPTPSDQMLGEYAEIDGVG